MGYVALGKPPRKRVSAFDFAGTPASSASASASPGDGRKAGEETKEEEDSKFEYQEVRLCVCRAR